MQADQNQGPFGVVKPFSFAQQQIQYQPEISEIRKTIEPGFTGDDPDSWFDEREMRRNMKSSMHTQDNDAYFDSYSHYAIHEEMIKDRIRTETYQLAIQKNAAQIKDKIVLDIGCGTGILSIFAARAGAAHVYSIDNAEIAEYARHIVNENGFSQQITVIKGKVEEITLPVEKVDIIISEWMGYFLLYESMLDTVLFARDKWLKPDGLIFPDKLSLFFAGFDDPNIRAQYREKFWSNIYGIDMSCIGKLTYIEPVVEIIPFQNVVTSMTKVFEVDMYTIKKEDAQFANSYSLRMNGTGSICGLIAWFDCCFEQRLEHPVKFTTSPFSTPTHWKQVLFYWEEPFDLEEGDKLYGSIAVRKNKKHQRELDIKLSVKCCDPQDNELDAGYNQYFLLT